MLQVAETEARIADVNVKSERTGSTDGSGPIILP